jgi:hypothetical protein
VLTRVLQFQHQPLGASDAAALAEFCVGVKHLPAKGLVLYRKALALQRSLAACTLELLAQARVAGFFKTETNRLRLRLDDYLAPLQPRADFQKFLADVEKSAASN